MLSAQDCDGGGAAVDTDGDGLSDLWESEGIDLTGDGRPEIDLPAMGADPRHKDLFLEIDFMVQDVDGDGLATGPGEHTHKPRALAIQDFVAAFANAPIINPDGRPGIAVHVDTGQFGGGNRIPHYFELDFSGRTHGDRRRPSIAQTGATVAVAWEDDRDRNGFAEVFLQLLGTDGTLAADEFAVNSQSGGQQLAPVVGAGGSRVVVAWQDDQDGNGKYQILARGFDLAGAAVYGLEEPTAVNTVAAGQQLHPGVAVDGNGNAVIVWEDDQDGNGKFQILARGFDANGNQRFAREAGTPINTVADGQQRRPVVAADAAGNFVVAWEDDQDGNGKYQILARGFDPLGNPRFSLEEPNPVNTAAAGQQRNPAIAMDAAGNFVIAWEDDQDGNGYHQIHARGFDANGAPRWSHEAGDPVNVVADGQQLAPSVGMEPAGGSVVVAWQDDQDGNGRYQVLARSFTAGGAERFGQQTVNVVSSGDQLLPGVTLDGGGAALVVWEDRRRSDGFAQVFLRGLDAAGGEVVSERLAHGRGSDKDFDDIRDAHFTPGRELAFRYGLFVHRRINTTSSGIANRPGQNLIVSLGSRTGQIGSRRQQAGTLMHELGHNLNLQHGGHEGRNNKPNYNSVMNYDYQMSGVDTDCDAVGNGVVDYSARHRRTLDEDALDESIGVCDGTIVVNRIASGQQVAPAVAMSAAGDFTVAWADDADENGHWQILARSFGLDGQPRFSLEEPTAVNSVASGEQLAPDVAVDPSGNVVITWQDDQDGNGKYQILARGFDVAGAPRFAREEPNAVNQVAAGQQLAPSVAVGPGGDFFVAWQDDQDENGLHQILARGFGAAGAPVWSREEPNPVNGVSAGEQRRPRVAAGGAGLVVTWEDDQDGNGKYQILARGFDAAGNPTFGLEEPTPVNSVASGQQLWARVAMDATGRFVVAWQDDQDGNGKYQILARGFAAGGAALWAREGANAVNSVASGQQLRPAVALDPNGNSVIVWQDDQDGNGFFQIHARGFDAAGAARFTREAASPVNAIARGQQRNPVAACDAAGNFVVVWEDDQDENGFWQILARLFDGAGNVLNQVAIDWDADGAITSPVAADVNGDSGRTTLSDSNDWGRIRLRL